MASIIKRAWVIIGLFAFLCCSGAQARNYSKDFGECINKASGEEEKFSCFTVEIVRQKNRLNVAYKKLSKSISVDSQSALDKVQHDWIVWRDGNYNFLSEKIAVDFRTARVTSLNFLLNSIYDRADEIEMMIDEVGN